MPDSSGVAGSFGLSRLRKKKNQACAIGVAFGAVCSSRLIADSSPSPMPELPRTALQWREGLLAVQKRGLLFELQVFAGQMAEAASLARDFPALTFVLLHAGMLEDTSDAGWAHWRTGMRV